MRNLRVSRHSFFSASCTRKPISCIFSGICELLLPFLPTIFVFAFALLFVGTFLPLMSSISRLSFLRLTRVIPSSGSTFTRSLATSSINQSFGLRNSKSSDYEKPSNDYSSSRKPYNNSNSRSDKMYGARGCFNVSVGCLVLNGPLTVSTCTGQRERRKSDLGFQDILLGCRFMRSLAVFVRSSSARRGAGKLMSCVVDCVACCRSSVAVERWM